MYFKLIYYLTYVEPSRKNCKMLTFTPFPYSILSKEFSFISVGKVGSRLIFELALYLALFGRSFT
jgi:hypothetical protein